MARDLYPEGVYTGTIQHHYVGTNEKGNDFALVVVAINAKVDPQDPANPKEIDSFTRSIRMVFTPKTVDFQALRLLRLGFDIEKKGDLMAFDERDDSFDIRGKEIQLECKHGEDDKGNSREEWDMARGVDVPEYRADADYSRTSEMLKNALAAKRSRTPRREPAPAPEPTGTVEGSPNPFLDDSPLPGGDGLDF
jgi:hypothetical protein